MMRLANYFLVVAYDHEGSKSGFGEGKVIQKLPVEDWKDCPFDQSIQEFCQPAGWYLSTRPRSPNFMVCALTNSTGGRLFCACLTFDEPFRLQYHAGDDSEADLFAPKSLVLLASHNYCSLLKNCLSLIYTIFSDNLQWELEKVVSNILAGIPIPSPGGPKVTFSLLGADDKQAVQPPQCGKIPITGTSVSLLFQLLGIQNVLMLFSAMLTDQKILITSRSFVRLFDVCHALSSLLYPLRYVCVYIPVLPRKLLDYLSTPTPCLVGIHVSFLESVNETYEFCIADIDKGSVEPPRNLVNLAPSELIMVSEPFYTTMLSNLTQILNPDLLTADLVFAPSPSSGKQRHTNIEEWTDKRLRAVFLQYFLQLFIGYRSCLSITRIHPQPVIHFNQSLFLLLRGLSDSDEFLSRFFRGMTFPQFIQERGSPYREVDLFDRMVAEKDVCQNTSISAVDYLAEFLMDNERNLCPASEQVLPQPRTISPEPKPFPVLDENKMQRRLRRNAERFPSCDEDEWTAKPETVPMGTVLDLDECLRVTTHDQMAKLNVLRSCLESIFDNRISDAKKVLRAVKRDLKSRVVRHHLLKRMLQLIHGPAGSAPGSPTQEAWPSMQRSTLGRAQFELVVELLDEALRQDAGAGAPSSGTLHHMAGVSFGGYGLAGSGGLAANGFFGSGLNASDAGGPTGQGPGSEADRSCDCSGIAASVLELATMLHMQVHNVKYFAYMCEEIQKHSVWEAYKFWKSFFHLEVAKQIHDLYRTRYPSAAAEGEASHGIVEAMEMAAEELRRWPDLEESERATWVAQEERSVLFQIQHCLTQILHFRLPVNVSERRYQQQLESFGGENASSIMTNSEDGTDSVDRESGFDEHAQATLLTSLDNFMRRFVRLVASENDLPQPMIDAIEEKIEGLREGDIATLDDVRREVKRPRAVRTEVTPPDMLQNEELMLEAPLRAFLLPDSRTDPCEQMQEVDPLLSNSTPPIGHHHHHNMGAHAARAALPAPVEGLLPAEGALFLTNYRVVFRGIPIDCLLTDRQICRSFPVSALLSVKKHGAQRVAALMSVSKDDAYDVMVLRATNFQLLRLAFEEDVSREDREYFRSLLLLCRYPLRLEASFLSRAALLEQQEEKAGDGAGKSKSTLTRARIFCKQTMEKARQKVSKRSHHVFQSPPFYRTGDRSRAGGPGSQTPSMPRPFIGNESKYLDFLQQRPAYKDITRQGLGHFQGTFSVRQNKTEGFKLSMVNSKYQVCPSYPAMLVMPCEVPERCLTRLVRGHKENRIPVVTYRHAPTKALLVRAGGFKHHQGTGWRSGGGHMSPISERETMGDSTDCAPSSVTGSEFLQEQEKYLSALVAHSPDPETISPANQEPLFPLETPLPGRRDFRDSGRSKNASGGDRRWSQAYGAPLGASVSANLLSGSAGGGGGGGGGYRRRGFDSELSSTCDQEAISEWSAISSSVTRLSLGPLVVLGEKSQMKFFSKTRRPSITFLPVVVPHTRKTLKESFKKLYRSCLTAEQPSVVTAAKDNFHAALNDMDWLRQVKGTLQLAGAVVDIMDTHGSSVMVALEEGWDLTTQVVSLAQLMLDAHYRTINGFAQLVDKEWLSFGHRFTQRGSQTEATKPSGYSPVFLLFLDCVHQILRQFPTQFEFNEYYLQFLAHHHLSNRFSSFKFDCEEERLYVTLGNTESSIWKFIETWHKQLPIFYNFMYVAPPRDGDLAELVLRPTTNIAALDVWGYFLSEQLCHGASVFDLDLLNRLFYHKPSEAPASGEQVPEAATVATFMQINYNSGLTTNAFTALHELLVDAGSHWMDVWESAQRETADQAHALYEETIDAWALDQSRQVAARVHKKCTRELLYRGRQLGEDHDAAANEEEAGLMFKQAHQFNSVPFSTSRRKCDLCSHWLLITAKAVVCAQCKYFCHERCAVNVPKDCMRPSAAPGPTPAHAPPPLPPPVSRPPPPRPPPPSDLPAPVSPPPPPPPVPPHATPPDASPTSTSTGPPVAIVTAKPAVGGPQSLGRSDRRSSLGSFATELGPGSDASGLEPAPAPAPVSALDKRATLGASSLSSMASGRAHATRSAAFPHQATLASQAGTVSAAVQFSGFLYKQGHYLRQWKRRYYVLDTLRHQLQYFETDDQLSYRGYIALHDVRSVKTTRWANFAPKKIPEHAFIEVEYAQRVHRFAADDARQAREWCERLQTAIS